jgi:hypothetical protein
MKKDLLSAFAITAMFTSILFVSAAEPLITSGAQLTLGVGSGLTEIVSAPLNTWYIIFPAMSGKPGAGNCAPASASASDWTATGFLMGMMQNGQLQNYDTDAAVWASNAPVGTDRNYLSFGGPLVNNFVCYYETTAAGSNVVLAVYQDAGANNRFAANTGEKPALIGIAGTDFDGLPLEIAKSSAGTSGTDLFLLEGFKDPSTGNIFVVAYGFTYFGTFAAGIYMKFILGNAGLPGLTNALYIVEWSGTAGALPAPGDTYTIVYTQAS